MMGIKHKIVLTGFSGTGKSEVGRLVANMLDWNYVDADSEIEKQFGMTTSAIFEAFGENKFRAMETEVIEQIFSRTNIVVILGGGAYLTQPQRMRLLNQFFVVTLEGMPRTILERINLSIKRNPNLERPLLKGSDGLANIERLKSERQDKYALTHWTINTDYLIQSEVAAEVVRAWQMIGPQLSVDDESRYDVAAVVSHSSAGIYDVRVASGLISKLGQFLLEMNLSDVAYIISDDTVFPIYGREVQKCLQQAGIKAHCFVLPAGEKSKTLEMAHSIYDWLVILKAERNHVVISVGGGVVGDLAGFVASTFVRGMNFVQVPTSMAAMVDASIGGKVAVNVPEGKNMIGAFYQPRLVIVDPLALNTLGKRELAEGWAEAIKHGLIFDEELIKIFEDNWKELMTLKEPVVEDVIRRSIALKAIVVRQDERELFGKRVLLNYGHTIGHGIETMTDYSSFLHGEAVSIGMSAAVKISHKLGMVDKEIVDRQESLLKKFDLPVKCPGLNVDELLGNINLDKKRVDGKMRWVLLSNIGTAVVRADVPTRVVREVIRELV